ncbi:MoaD/ThiS family protein [Lactococcus termiticola]|uniref:Molybdenum cofactor biosynthesis protein D n=1 Tax=Lactococcus termiticola TaxID=2169526 RepID=A0A2R5HE33_9LACT|nr:MoaD/ThiS family protein [Lactococcus termiticola]GBG96334.1 molybdenum cofactor biosynthesis protein D [Lactococcus termiticola]
MGEIILFGELGEFLGNRIQIELPESFDKQDILELLTKGYPNQAQDIAKCNVAVNQTYIYDEQIKREDAREIAIIPPVSGG